MPITPYSFSSPLLAALCAALAGAVSGCSSAGAPTTSHPSIDDLKECNADHPSLACLQRLFLPLASTSWPFDAELARRAFVQGGSYTLPHAKLTALHVIDAELQQLPGVADHPPHCSAAQTEVSAPGTTFHKENCGDFLFIGGSPASLACEEAGQGPWACSDTATVAESFDIGLLKTDEAGDGFLDVTDQVEVGEEVFAIGTPSFLLVTEDPELSNQIGQWFGPRYPIVSSGVVIDVDGRGLVISNLMFPGNSGGPILNSRGQVVGVASTKISDLRAVGTETNPQYPSYRGVATRIDAAMKARVDAERALGLSPQ